MKVLRYLNIKKSESRSILMLVVYSFFMGLSLAFFFTATISEFLTHFEITVLPYTYILSGVLGYLLWLLWSFLERKIGFSSRLILGILFLFVTVGIFWACIFRIDDSWLFFVMLIWVRVFVFVNMVNFWGMAGKLFNLSQGKRLFGVITIGSVISEIFGFFSIPLILLLGFDNTGLVQLSLIAIAICLVITILITRMFKNQLREEPKVNLETRKARKKEPFFKSKYHYYLFSLAILPMFGFYFVDYLFLDQIKLEYRNSSEAMAGFMGIFFGITAIFDLFVKSSVFGRLILNFGLKLALLILPVLLLITSVLTIVAGLVAGSMGFLFSMIAFIKLLEKVMRSSINDPAFQILYQPIPAEERLAFQSKMEGVPSAMGNILAGMILLLMIYFGLTDPIIFNFIFLLVLIFWTYMAVKMQKEYKNVIVNNLTSEQTESSQELVSVEQNIRAVLLAQIDDKDDNRVSTAIALLQFISIQECQENLLDLVKHRSRSVSIKALNIINENRLLSFISPLISAGNEVDDVLIKEKILAVIKELKEQEAISPNTSFDQLSSMTIDQKLSLVKHLKSSEDSKLKSKTIETLLCDKSPVVVREVCEQLHPTLERQIIQFVIDNIEDISWFHLIMPYFEKSNVQLESLLIRKLQLAESGQNWEVKQKLAAIKVISWLAKIGGTEVENSLVKMIESGNSEIRFFSLKAMSLLNYKSGPEDKVLFTQKIEKEVGLYTWLLACLQDLKNFSGASKSLSKALKQECDLSQSRMFLYLKFIYSPVIVQQIHDNLSSSFTDRNVMAMEMCELLFSPTLKTILIPVFLKVSKSEKLKLLKREYPHQSLKPIRRLENIVYHDFTMVSEWLKILAMDVLSKKSTKVSKELLSSLHIKNLALKESAFLAIANVDALLFEQKMSEESKEYQLHFVKLMGSDPKLGKSDSIFEIVNKLKKITVLKSVNESVLLKFANYVVKMEWVSSEYYGDNYPLGNLVHFVTHGSLMLERQNSNEEIVYKVGDTCGMDTPISLRNQKFNASDGAEIFAIESGIFFEIVVMYDLHLD